MKTEKVDRRVRKTKARLTEVLLTLMKEKEVKDISVKELSDLADINRGRQVICEIIIYTHQAGKDGTQEGS